VQFGLSGSARVLMANDSNVCIVDVTPVLSCVVSGVPAPCRGSLACHSSAHCSLTELCHHSI
jgi:hypothetical protein